MHTCGCDIDGSPLQVDDCIDFSKEIREKTGPSVPHFIGGQSMGGLVAALVALQDQSVWDGLILCSAAMDVEWTPMLRFVQATPGNKLCQHSQTASSWRTLPPCCPCGRIIWQVSGSTVGGRANPWWRCKTSQQGWVSQGDELLAGDKQIAQKVPV